MACDAGRWVGGSRHFELPYLSQSYQRFEVRTLNRLRWKHNANPAFTHQYCVNIRSLATLFLAAVTISQTTLQCLHSTEVRIRRDEARKCSLNLAWTVTPSSHAFPHVITRHQPSPPSLAQCVYWNLARKSKHEKYKFTTYAVSNGQACVIQVHLSVKSHWTNSRPFKSGYFILGWLLSTKIWHEHGVRARLFFRSRI